MSDRYRNERYYMDMEARVEREFEESWDRAVDAYKRDRNDVNVRHRRISGRCDDESDDEMEGWLTESFKYHSSVEHKDRETFNLLLMSIRKNSPRLTEVNPDGYPKKYSDLGKALTTNTNVTSIHLDLRKLCRDGVHGVLLRRIRTHPSLRSIGLHGGRLTRIVSNDPNRVTKKCLHAITDNANITELTLDIRVPVGDLTFLLRAADNIHTLDLILGEYDTAGQKLIGAAFESNQTLERLVLQPTSNASTVEVVLWHLKSHVRLRELELLAKPVHNNSNTIFGHIDEDVRASSLGIMKALASSLAHGTLPLVSLRIFGFCFDETPLKKLLVSVESCPSLEKLAMNHCEFRYDSVHWGLTPFLQKKRGELNLHELCLKGSFQNRMEVQYTPLEDDVGADILIQQNGAIGSTLRSITVGDAFADGLWDAMAVNAKDVKLSHLSFSSLQAADWTKILRCLPKLTHLQELELRDVWAFRVYDAYGLLRSVRGNGSLRKLSFCIHGDAPVQNHPIFDTPFMRACITRNIMVPQLLARPHVRFNGLLVPHLFEVSLQARPTARTNLLIGLIALGDAIEPPPDAKIKRLCKWSVCPVCRGPGWTQPKGQRDIRQYFPYKFTKEANAHV